MVQVRIVHPDAGRPVGEVVDVPPRRASRLERIGYVEPVNDEPTTEPAEAADVTEPVDEDDHQ
jgi:hypothetical protein